MDSFIEITEGSMLGRYRVDALIERGGMGIVYRAFDTRLQRIVAVKVLHKEFLGDPERVRRFEREARAVSRLSHPNVVSVYDIGSEQGCSYLVCEHLTGVPLRKRLNGLTISRALDYALQILRGLAAAHRKGIVHRDIKPENIFLTDYEVVKLLDFGLAKLQPRSDETEYSSHPGVVMGTLAYMAPEQITGPSRLDVRADIFSFGVVLYEMLGGANPFRRDAAEDTLRAILVENPPPLDLPDTALNERLQLIVQRCCEKKPTRRFQSAQDLIALFEQARLSAPSTPVGGPAAPTGVRSSELATSSDAPHPTPSPHQDWQRLFDELVSRRPKDLLDTIDRIVGVTRARDRDATGGALCALVSTTADAEVLHAAVLAICRISYAAAIPLLRSKLVSASVTSAKPIADALVRLRDPDAGAPIRGAIENWKHLNDVAVPGLVEALARAEGELASKFIADLVPDLSPLVLLELIEKTQFGPCQLRLVSAAAQAARDNEVRKAAASFLTRIPLSR